MVGQSLAFPILPAERAYAKSLVPRKAVKARRVSSVTWPKLARR